MGAHLTSSEEETVTAVAHVTSSEEEAVAVVAHMTSIKEEALEKCGGEAMAIHRDIL